MPATDWRRWLASGLVVGTLACVQNPAPKGWLMPAQEAQSDHYGAWILISRGDSVGAVSGEFLAVERDSVFVLSPDGKVHAVAVGSTIRAQVAFYDAQWGKLAGWSALGALSTVSNGLLSVITFPIWIIGGSIAAGSQSNDPIRRVERADAWDAVRMFARFPAGLPPDVPRRLPPRVHTP